MYWTCAVGVLPLALACDPQLEQPEAEDLEIKNPEPPRRGAGMPLDPAIVKATVRQGRPVEGAEDAKVEIMVWSDFECPYCRKVVGTLEDVVTAYPDEVRLVFKQMPLPMHPNAAIAAKASLAAQRQGKFWEMHDAMFEQPARIRAGEFAQMAAEVGLDVDRFEADMNDPELSAMVDVDRDDAATLGIRGTPSTIVGNTLVVGAQPLSVFKSVVEAELDAS
jgi:protein-disulfide isomerase